MVSDSVQKLDRTIEEDAANVDGSVPKRPHLEGKANGLGIFLVFLFLLELTLVTVYIALVSCIVIFVHSCGGKYLRRGIGFCVELEVRLLELSQN
ncbi:hypothetical protein H5410_004138 [Solanum commersonii]|uniref:Uncharacterized protein n=1 Tax=Solanum commersonii TaxID=4109 RepID=A0A9J6B6J4_SOLCO|nr:hypothetical protein H5410_004138 [Solanum commersonii]